jgi:hypothetical protein
VPQQQQQQQQQQQGYHQQHQFHQQLGYGGGLKLDGTFWNTELPGPVCCSALISSAVVPCCSALTSSAVVIFLHSLLARVVSSSHHLVDLVSQLASVRCTCLHCGSGWD